MNTLLADLFHVPKPVIAMVHFPPLPGTPLYDEKRGVEGILESVRRDLRVLLDGGVDGLLFCNEGDRPYALQADFEAIAVMTRVITETAPRDRPFGVDFLWDPKAPLAIALATGAAFVREVFTGVYESDMGLWNTNPAAMLRYRRNIGASHIKVFYNITPEFASPIGRRSVGQVARSAVVSSLADALLVSGPMAGAEPDLNQLREAKEATGGQVPVLLNTGARAENIRRFFSVADGVIVGSGLKVDGYTWNPVDPARVKAFMEVVRDIRRNL
ncbi:MAG: BtpA/SgcQ family protein [Anaerolineae bacterium]|nr:BtpA/SgcQ family protein [Candidatus Roseilinea sp.]MDW8451299.1 BtpA/SgcQ family protein [Anaerolineae bacterium]